jgi:hypothetical protein
MHFTTLRTMLCLSLLILCAVTGSPTLAQTRSGDKPSNQYVVDATGKTVTLNATAAKGASCQMGDVLDALLLAETLFVPRTAETPKLATSPYDDQWLTNGYTLQTVPAIIKLDLERATPEQLRREADERERVITGVNKHNAALKAKVARRNLAAEHIRALLSVCGVQIAKTCDECGEIQAPGGSIAVQDGASALTLPSHEFNSGTIAGTWTIDESKGGWVLLNGNGNPDASIPPQPIKPRKTRKGRR